MAEDVMQSLIEKAKSSPKRVVFPEGAEEKIIQAAHYLFEMKMAFPILLGNELEIKELANRLSLNLTGIEIVDNNNSEILELYAKEFTMENPIYPIKIATRMLQNPLHLGAMMVKMEQADAMVAGLSYSTGEVIMSGQMFIGMQEGIKTVSSIFLMSIPGYEGSEGNNIVFADAGVCPDPSVDELADITITTAETVQALLRWEPRIAMLSFSTKGSAEHAKVEHVNQALDLVKKRRPDLLVDGEFQADAAIVPEVAARKVKEKSPVAGIANILIFPDLNSGNIAYKLVQRLAKADAYGPFLQGFKKTVGDLSRGSSVQDIIGVTTLAIVRAQSL